MEAYRTNTKRKQLWLSLALCLALVTVLGALVQAESARLIPAQRLPDNYTTQVAIARGIDYAQVTRESISLLGGLKDIVKPGQTVLIKPNLVGPGVPGGGRLTDYRVVQEIVNMAREAGASRVLVSEGPVDASWDYVFTMAGYKRITGAELHNLNTDRSGCDTVRLERSLTGVEWYLPRIWFEADVIIDVAVMKTHNAAGVTLSLKNIGIGLPPQAIYAPPGKSKNVLHDRNIDLVIPDINAMRKADLYVVDGMVAGEGEGPVRPTPRPMNMVLASRDPVALDTVGTIIMGYEPTEIAHIMYAAGIGLGTHDLARIEVLGVPLADARVAKPFVRPKAQGAPYKKATVIREAGAPVAVDGSLTEWSAAMVNAIADKTRVVTGADHWTGVEDAAADAMLLYKDRVIYLAMQLRDDAVVSGENGDEARLVLSFNRVYKQKVNTYRRISPSSDIILAVPVREGEQAVTAQNNGRTLAGAKAVVKRQNGGYILEAAIPLAALSGLPGTNNLNWRTGLELAVDFHYIDVDPGQSAPSVLMWSGGGVQPHDPSDMGRAVVY